MSLTETEYLTNWQYFLLHDLSVDVLSAFGGWWRWWGNSLCPIIPIHCRVSVCHRNWIWIQRDEFIKLLFFFLFTIPYLPPTITEHLLSFHNLSRARTERGIILTLLFCFTTRERKNVLLLRLINSWTKHTLFRVSVENGLSLRKTSFLRALMLLVE